MLVVTKVSFETLWSLLTLMIHTALHPNEEFIR